jgi:hypothetical protein
MKINEELNNFNPNFIIITKNDNDYNYSYLLYQKITPMPFSNEFISNKFIFFLPILHNNPTEFIRETYIKEESLNSYATKGFIYNIFGHQILPLVHKSLQEIYLKLKLHQQRNFNDRTDSIPDMLDLIINGNEENIMTKELKSLGLNKHRIREISDLNEIFETERDLNEVFVILKYLHIFEVENEINFIENDVFKILSVFSVSGNGKRLAVFDKNKILVFKNNKVDFVNSWDFEEDSS